jgi:hypothetical protein
LKAGGYLLFRWFFAELISSTLKLEAICSSGTSVDTQRTTRRHIPEDDAIHNHCCENLKSYIDLSGSGQCIVSDFLENEIALHQLSTEFKHIINVP